MFHTPTTYAGAVLILLMLIVPPWTVHEYATQPPKGTSGSVNITTNGNTDPAHAGTEVRLRPVWSTPEWTDETGQHEGRIDFEQLFLQILIVALVTGIAGAAIKRNG